MVVLVLPGQEGNRHSHYPHSFGFGGGEVTFSKVVDECVQLHGGYGYMLEYPIARAYVDTRANRIYGGTNEIMKELISRSI